MRLQPHQILAGVVGAVLFFVCLAIYLWLPNPARDEADAATYFAKEFNAILRYREGDSGDVVGLDLLNNQKIDDAKMARAAALIHLEELVLTNTKVGDKGLAHLKKLSALNKLNLTKTPITDAGLVHLKGLPLTELNLNDTQVADAGMKTVKEIRSLQNLSLEDTKVGDVGVEELVGLEKLDELDLTGAPITNDAVSSLQKLPNLKSLRLKGVKKLTDECGPVFGKFPSLRKLNLDNTKLTDAGVATLVDALKLTGLSLRGVKLEGSALEKLAANRPDLAVDRRE